MLALRLLRVGRWRAEEDAEHAEHLAGLAMDALRVERDIHQAAEYAEEAADLERQYGDAPTWGPLAAAMRAARAAQLATEEQEHTEAMRTPAAHKEGGNT